MAYDEILADRVRKLMRRRKGYAERKMFGGLCFTLNGHMTCGINGDDLMLRLGPEGAEAALKEKHTREMDFTGRPLKGMVYVTPKGTATDDALKTWIKRAAGFTTKLPPK